MLEGRQLGSWRVGCFHTFLAAKLNKMIWRVGFPDGRSATWILEGRMFLHIFGRKTLKMIWRVGCLDSGRSAAWILEGRLLLHISGRKTKQNDLEGRLPGWKVGAWILEGRVLLHIFGRKTLKIIWGVGCLDAGRSAAWIRRVGCFHISGRET